MNVTVAHLLDPTANSLAKQLSRSCEPYAQDPPFVLEEHTQIAPAIPHLGHLSLEIEQDRLGELHRALRILINERLQPTIISQFSGIEYCDRRLLWRVKPAVDLRLLHHYVLRACAELGRVEKSDWPSVTLSVLRDPPPCRSDLVRAYADTSYPWSSNLMVIGALGKRGELTKILGRLPLY
jgi:hypothetical protein